MQHNFLFFQSKKTNWSQIRDQLTKALNDIIRESSYGKVFDFEVEIKEICKKRSGQQLRAYWVLISKITKWMNTHGNHFTNDQVSDYFKISSGHMTEIENFIIPRSIANKSDCTKEQMERLITEIIKFGAEHDIEDCFIRDDDLAALLEYYR